MAIGDLPRSRRRNYDGDEALRSKGEKPMTIASMADIVRVHAAERGDKVALIDGDR